MRRTAAFKTRKVISAGIVLRASFDPIRARFKGIGFNDQPVPKAIVIDVVGVGGFPVKGGATPNGLAVVLTYRLVNTIADRREIIRSGSVV